MPVINANKIISDIARNIYTYYKKNKYKKAIMAISDDIESVVGLKILSRAIQPQNTLVFYYKKDFHEKIDWFDNFSQYSGISIKDEKSYFNLALKDKNQSLFVLAKSECRNKWFRFFPRPLESFTSISPFSSLSVGELFQIAIELKISKRYLISLYKNQEVEEKDIKNYFDLELDWTFSQVDIEGNYSKVGTIEKISRYFDFYKKVMAERSTNNISSYLVSQSKNSFYEPNNFFPNHPANQIYSHLSSARTLSSIAFAINPKKISPLISRDSFLARGYLTNTLPRM